MTFTHSMEDNSEIRVSPEVKKQVKSFIDKSNWEEWNRNIGTCQDPKKLLRRLTLPKISPTWEPTESPEPLTESRWRTSEAKTISEAYGTLVNDLLVNHEKDYQNLQHKKQTKKEKGNRQRLLKQNINFIKYHLLITIWVLKKDYESNTDVTGDKAYEKFMEALYEGPKIVWALQPGSRSLTTKVIEDLMDWAVNGFKLLRSLGDWADELPLHNYTFLTLASKCRYPNAEEYIIRKLKAALMPQEGIRTWSLRNASAANIVEDTLAYRENPKYRLTYVSPSPKVHRSN
ncbi:hypothetical protein VCV18_011468 [Metarhizium anisopliae]